MFKCWITKLIEIDIFGTSLEFTTFRKSKYQTLLGGIFSIFAICIILIFSIIFSLDFFNKTNPKIIQSIVRPEEYPEPTILNDENFMIIFRLSDINGKPFNFSEILYPVVYQIKYKMNSTGYQDREVEDIPFRKCSKEQIDKGNIKIKSDDWYCIDFNHKNYTFGGGWDAEFIHYFTLSIYSCPNGENFSENSNCTDKKLLKDLLIPEGVYFECWYPKYQFNPNDFENPFRLRYDTFYNELSLNLIKTETIYLQKAVMKNDDGWITENEKNISIYSGTLGKTDYYFRTNDEYGIYNSSSLIYDFIINYQNHYDYIERSYMKIQDVYAIIGGFKEIVFLILGIIPQYLSPYIRNKEFFNQIFEYDTEKKETKL